LDHQKNKAEKLFSGSKWQQNIQHSHSSMEATNKLTIFIKTDHSNLAEVEAPVPLEQNGLLPAKLLRRTIQLFEKQRSWVNSLDGKPDNQVSLKDLCYQHEKGKPDFCPAK
jgi:hypothetical protein